MIGIGAIIGDMFGSKYEFGKYGFKFNKEEYIKNNMTINEDDLVKITDDTILTLALKKSFIDANNETSTDTKMSFESYMSKLYDIIVKNFNDYGNKYINFGYGKKFLEWLIGKNKFPYNSYGNGSAMRVSSVGYISNNINDTLELAKLSAVITHNHPEGIKGAQAISSCIFAARCNYTKDEIKSYIHYIFGYNLDIKSNEVYNLESKQNIPGYDISCQLTVPEAILCFMESNSFEECIINAVSLNGDTDTRAAIAGSIAEAYYGVPDYLIEYVINKLDVRYEDLLTILLDDDAFVGDAESYKPELKINGDV